MREFASFAEIVIAEIPVVIPTFNNPAYVRNMTAQLFCRGLRNIVVIDNGSTAPDMRASFLLARRVVHLNDNRGPHYIFREDREFDALPNLFCVTDPDLEFNQQLPDDFLIELIGLTEEFRVGKVGFSLDVSDKAAMREDDFQNSSRICKIWEWEQQFWEDQIGSTRSGDPIYRADIDTTFAVYNKKYFSRDNFYDALRLAGRYTCRHLPWYRDNGMAETEAAYYASTQKFSTYFSPIKCGAVRSSAN